MKAPVKLFDAGAKVRLSAMGTMFFLGAALGGRGWVHSAWWLAGAVVFSLASAVLFIRWCDELEAGTRGAPRP